MTEEDSLRSEVGLDESVIAENASTAADEDSLKREIGLDESVIAEKNARIAQLENQLTQQSTRNQVYSDAKQFASTAADKVGSLSYSLLHSSWFYLFFILGLLLFYFDSFFGQQMARSDPTSFALWATIWILYGVFVDVTSIRSLGWDWKSFGSAMARSAVHILGPLVAYLYVFIEGLFDFVPAASFYSEVVLTLITPAIIVFFFGWPWFLLSDAAKKSKFWGFLQVVGLFFFLSPFFVALIPTLMMSFESLPAAGAVFAGAEGLSSVPRSIPDLYRASVSAIRNYNVSNRVSSLTSGNSSFASAFVPEYLRPYSGSVERQQGEPLGVFIRNQEALQSSYVFSNVSEDFTPISWFGEVHSRTFAENGMRVELFCELVSRVSGDTELVYRTSAQPSFVNVLYTPDFTDQQSFTCSLSDPSRISTGSLRTVAEFDFETTGYATLSFMDIDLLTSLRQQNLNPSSELGVPSRVEASYTPGPVSLGMMERQSLPIPVDVDNPQFSSLPSVGITLANEWISRGEVQKVHDLHLFVPSPFILNTSGCIGVDGDQFIVTQENLISDSFDVINVGNQIFSDIGLRTTPEGYTSYYLSDLEFSSQTRSKTVRCPLTVRPLDYPSLVGSGLNPRLFTFVAHANYRYELESSVPSSVSIRSVRS